MLLECKNIKKSFDAQEVLKGIDLSLDKGEILTILGESGCGKSTLLRIILGLERQDGGELSIEDRVVSSQKTFIEPNKRALSMVFQDYALMPHLNVRANILFSIPKLDKKEQNKRLEHIVAILGIEDLLERYVHELSGGQQQRVALARALIVQPKLILFDEPFSNLDENLKQNLRQELKALIKKLDIGAVFVTHDKQDAFFVSDKVALIKDGKILQMGSPKELYEHPNSRYVAKFMGDINIFSDEDKSFGLRLEDCFLSKTKTKLKGKVEDIGYCGSYNLIKVELENKELVELKIPKESTLELAQDVFIAFDKDKIINFS